MRSLGFVEVSGVSAAIDALDIMCKAAEVELVSWERKLGGRLVTVIVTGSVSAVTAAVDSAVAHCIKKPCAHVRCVQPREEIAIEHFGAVKPGVAAKYFIRAFPRKHHRVPPFDLLAVIDQRGIDIRLPGQIARKRGAGLGVEELGI